MQTLWFILIAAYGACVGSFLNVVIYRMPRDESLVHPGSHCPRCGHGLAWFENIPVLGWLALRGKCRHCGQPISMQYPVVEAMVMGLFALVCAGYFVSGFRETFMELGLERTWPALIVHLLLAAGLYATTVIDARYYIIPLPVTWVVAGAAAVLLPLAAWLHPETVLMRTLGGMELRQLPILPLAGPSFWNMLIGAVVGLVVAIVLLRRGIIPQSFAPTPEEEERMRALAEQKLNQAGASGPPADGKQEEMGNRWFGRGALAVVVTLGVLLGLAGWGNGWAVMGGMMLVGVGALLVALLEKSEDPAAIHGTPEQWLAHPSPRREVLKELLFLAWPVGGAVLGHYLLPTGWIANWHPATAAPHVLAGVAMGYLVGGMMIWGTRLLGTMAFGKEAMGLGDVHLLACIGAVLGPVDAILVFFLAPVLGLLATLVSVGASKIWKGEVRAVPYGPYLALAALVMMLLRDKALAFLQL